MVDQYLFILNSLEATDTRQDRSVTDQDTGHGQQQIQKELLDIYRVAGYFTDTSVKT